MDFKLLPLSYRIITTGNENKTTPVNICIGFEKHETEVTSLDAEVV